MTHRGGSWPEEFAKAMAIMAIIYPNTVVYATISQHAHEENSTIRSP